MIGKGARRVLLCFGIILMTSCLPFKWLNSRNQIRTRKIHSIANSDRTNSSTQNLVPSSDPFRKPFVSSKEELFSSSVFKQPTFDYYYDSEEDTDTEEEYSGLKGLPDALGRNKKTTYVGKNPVAKGLFGETTNSTKDDNKIDVFDIVEQVDEFRFSFNLSSFEEALERKASLQARSIPIEPNDNSSDKEAAKSDSDVMLKAALLDRVATQAEVIDTPDSTVYRLEVDPDELQDFIDQVDRVDNELMEFGFSDKNSGDSGNRMREINNNGVIDASLVEAASRDDTMVPLTELDEMLEKKLDDPRTTVSRSPPKPFSWEILKAIKFQAYAGEAGLDLLSMVYFGTISISFALLIDVFVSTAINAGKTLLQLPIIRAIVSDSLSCSAVLTGGLLFLMYRSFKVDLKEQFAVTLGQYLWSLPFVRAIRFLACFFIKKGN